MVNYFVVKERNVVNFFIVIGGKQIHYQMVNLFVDIHTAKAMTKEYIYHYNYVRDHQGLNYVTPFSIYSGQVKAPA